MQAQEIKQMAFRASKEKEINLQDQLRQMAPTEKMYFLEMLYYYRIYNLGGISVEEAKEIEQRVYSEFANLNNALRLSEEEYQRYIRCKQETNSERTKLVKQIRDGDRDFIHTLLHLLDIFSREMIYDKLYRAMRSPLTDADLDQMIGEVPEEYRGPMTPEETRAAVWNVVRYLSGDAEIT